MSYNRNTSIWGTEAGEQILIKDLTDSHYVNIMNWMQRKSSFYPDEFFQFMVVEGQHRAMLNFTKGMPRPIRQEDGTYALIG